MRRRRAAPEPQGPPCDQNQRADATGQYVVRPRNGSSPGSHCGSSDQRPAARIDWFCAYRFANRNCSCRSCGFAGEDAMTSYTGPTGPPWPAQRKESPLSVNWTGARGHEGVRKADSGSRSDPGDGFGRIDWVDSFRMPRHTSPIRIFRCRSKWEHGVAHFSRRTERSTFSDTSNRQRRKQRADVLRVLQHPE